MSIHARYSHLTFYWLVPLSLLLYWRYHIVTYIVVLFQWLKRPGSDQTKGIDSATIQRECSQGGHHIVTYIVVLFLLLQWLQRPGSDQTKGIDSATIQRECSQGGHHIVTYIVVLFLLLQWLQRPGSDQTKGIDSATFQRERVLTGWSPYCYIHCCIVSIVTVITETRVWPDQRYW